MDDSAEEVALDYAAAVNEEIKDHRSVRIQKTGVSR
jgi:methionine synthase II (cobalamin-independent)